MVEIFLSFLPHFLSGAWPALADLKTTRPNRQMHLYLFPLRPHGSAVVIFWKKLH